MICQDTANTHTGLSEHVQSESSEQGIRGQTVWWHILIPCFPTHLRRQQNDWLNIYVHQMSSCRRSISFLKKARTPGSRCSSLAAGAVGIVIAESSQTNVLLCKGPSKDRGGKKEQGDWQLHIGDFFSKLGKNQ